MKIMLLLTYVVHNNDMFTLPVELLIINVYTVES